VDQILSLPIQLNENLHIVWTFMLILTRMTALFGVFPGLGEGQRGLPVRGPAIFLFSVVAMFGSPYAAMPSNWLVIAFGLVSEFMLGLCLGFIPILIIAGVQTAGHLASTTMGLGAAQLMDPSMGVHVSDIARIYGDLAIVLFLLLGGHHILMYTASGMGGQLVPGTFVMNDLTVDFLVGKSSQIFSAGIMISSPVVVALLLTNFVMGMITKAVPTVNIFIVSFPLTIGIGLIISIIAIPEMIQFVSREFAGVESSVATIVEAGTQGHADAQIQ
jgi:flagellar biosynthetic protein FliR